ncbi:MAG: hypothetical protein K2J85_06570, partial [Anaeroplasmataceae bacterium]|nr:hypothetical protein [Anaeroplasmataceae bacterium]
MNEMTYETEKVRDFVLQGTGNTPHLEFARVNDLERKEECEYAHFLGEYRTDDASQTIQILPDLVILNDTSTSCLLSTSPSPRARQTARM